MSDLLEFVINFLNIKTSLFLPDEYEIALWIWGIIFGVITGAIRLIYKKIKDVFN